MTYPTTLRASLGWAYSFTIVTSIDKPYSGTDWSEFEPQKGAPSFLRGQAPPNKLLRDRSVFGFDI
jgi:hypothetical protein